MDRGTLINVGHLLTSEVGTKYRTLQWLGTGGNCQVFLVAALSGRHQGALFALKVFLPTHKKDRLDKFNGEAEFLKDCDHPAIMKVFDSGNVRIPGTGGLSEHPFIVADYYPTTLLQALGRGLRLSEKVIFIMQLLSALQFLANLNPPVVHRDIKPQNIFVKGYSCALGDFGLMKRLDGITEEGLPHVAFKESRGPGMPRYYRTPDLVAYAKGEGPLTIATDLFQLGLVAAELFCDKNPLKESEDILSPIELDKLRQISGKHGLAIVDFINRMLVIEAAKRESITDLLDPWEGILMEVTRDYHYLEGKAF